MHVGMATENNHADWASREFVKMKSLVFHSFNENQKKQMPRVQ